MRTRLRRVVLLSLLCLTTFTTSASAECAWVMWMINGVLSEGTPWVPSHAFVTRQDCVAAAQQTFKKFNDGKATVMTEEPADGSFFLVSRPPMPLAVIAIKCLPDTVDPRGPKQK